MDLRNRERRRRDRRRRLVCRSRRVSPGNRTATFFRAWCFVSEEGSAARGKRPRVALGTLECFREEGRSRPDERSRFGTFSSNASRFRASGIVPRYPLDEKSKDAQRLARFYRPRAIRTLREGCGRSAEGVSDFFCKAVGRRCQHVKECTLGLEATGTAPPLQKRLSTILPDFVGSCRNQHVPAWSRSSARAKGSRKRYIPSPCFREPLRRTSRGLDRTRFGREPLLRTTTT